MRLVQRKHVTISLFHSLIRAQVEDLGCLIYLLLVKNVRPNILFSIVEFIFNEAHLDRSHLSFDTFILKR
jgi:hypothetical protein